MNRARTLYWILFRRERVEAELERGMPREDAQPAAHVVTMIEARLKDVRYALRILRKNPGLLAVAVCSLAIGIGATSAIYSIADGMLLHPLPVPRANEVIAVSLSPIRCSPGSLDLISGL